MSNYNPEFRRDNNVSPPYTRESSKDDVHLQSEEAHRDRGLGSPSPQNTLTPDQKPTNLSVNPASNTAYTPYYASASPTSPSNQGQPPTQPTGDKSYKAYRPPVQQVYSTDSVIPSQPHGPYTAYQPPKPVTSTSQPPVLPPVKPVSPVISPLLQPSDHRDDRPISPPNNRLPSPIPTPPVSSQTMGSIDNQLGGQRPAPSPYAPPSVSDSVTSTPTEYIHGSPQPIGHPPVASGPFTPQGGTYQQQPQQSYQPLRPSNSVLAPEPTHYQQQSPVPGGPPAAFPTSPGGAYAPMDSQGKAYTVPVPNQQPPSGYGADIGPSAPSQKPPLSATGSTASVPDLAVGYSPYSPPGQTIPLSSYFNQGSAAGSSAPPQSYAVELPSSPTLPNAPPKPQKQLSFTLPPSDIYAERIANYMNMLEKEASLQPTSTPTPGQPEPEDLETRRNKVFRDWVISEAVLRGPKFATDLADDLDSLSFGSTRGSGQYSAKPRGSGPPGATLTSQPGSYSQQPRVTQVDVAHILPLLYPPPPPKVSASSRLAPFQRTFASASNLSFIDKNRQSFVANQSEIERKIQAEIDEVRRRRGKRNPQDAENVVREIRKREGQDAYERFDRDVVSTTYGELMKTSEMIDTVKQGVEDFVKDNADNLSTSELLEVLSFLTAVQDFSTTVHNHMESLLTERSMKYMYSLTVPLYEANNAAEAKKIEAWNQGVVAGQVADNKQAEEKRVGSYTKFVTETCDQAIAREKTKTAELSKALTELVRAVDGGLRDNGRIDFNIPPNEDIRPYDNTEEGKLLWLRSRILAAAIAIQGSIDSQKTLQKTKDVAARLGIKARYAAQEADAVKQHPTNQQKNIEDINKLREQQAREIEGLNRNEESDSEQRGVERGRFEATVRPATDALKSRGVAVGGDKANNWLKSSNEEGILGWK